jgi:hypothetical protein
MSEKLLSTQNTSKVEKLVRKAAAAKFGCGKAKPHYEHGHWWVVLDDAEGDEVFYDVVDSYPSVANTGLSFERL